MPNGHHFMKTFKVEPQQFFAKPNKSLRALFATADSEFYKEMTQMTFGGDWNVEKRRAAYTNNMQRVAGSVNDLLATSEPDRTRRAGHEDACLVRDGQQRVIQRARPDDLGQVSEPA